MSSVDASLPSLRAFVDPEESIERFRALAITAGAILIGSFLSVFYYVTSIAGGSFWLSVVVVGSLAGATVVADRIEERTATGIGLALFAIGGAAYVAVVPQVVTILLDLDFVVAVLSYLTGVSVLQFLRVDVWAIGLAPAPTFLSWYLLLRRRYAATAVVAGIALGFFAFTGNASSTVLLLGVIGMFGLFAFGTLERVDGGWEQVERVGLVVVLSVIAARLFSVIPEGNRGGDFGPEVDQPTLEASLLNADESVEVLGSISLSPEVRFTIEASRPAYWHAGAYNRYTGDSWIRTGGSAEYDLPLDPPPGRSEAVDQRVDVRTELFSMPAAWKPVRLLDAPESDVRVTSHGSLVPAGTLSDGESYRVESEVPARDRELLRRAGTDYPDPVRAAYLEVPDRLPDRVAEQARQIAGDAETPYDAAVAIEQWLTASKGYSLDVDEPEGDIVDGFVFEMEAGYCVYFASAMAIMLRTLDIPTRFVVGYTTGQQVAENRWVVRGLDSHSWVDVFFPGVGWIPFDPTPTSARVVRQRQRVQVARRRNESNVDAAGTLPDTPTPTPTPTASPDDDLTVTAPDPQAPESTPTPQIPDLAGRSGGPGLPFVTDVNLSQPNGTGPSTSATTPGNPVVRFLAERDRVSILAGIAGVAIGVHHFGLVDRVRDEMWLRHQSPTDSPMEDVERAYARLERVLSRRYRERDDGETPRQYLRALDAEGADLDDRVSRVASIREHARYAGETSRERADEAISIVNDVVGDSEV